MMVPPCDRDEWAPRPHAFRRAAVDAVLRVRLGAEWVAPSLARDRLTTWLTEHRWPSDQLDDVVFAVSEAVSNSVEHGYGIEARSTARPDHAPVEIDAEVVPAPDGGRQIVLAVRDRGTWRPPVPGPSDRGRGLPLIRSCMAEVVLRPTAAGTTLVIRTPSVPQAAPRS
ncbi:ATP-binding protein [Pseudonocardia xinjiangensis]|uniref:ATP-binding protein n=1 Tax=Pseudonocardia xinjiangensis TaxID=75289 RepID=A0ABX1RCF8_9PSEU|nr:ATP-binding protein [Pseudonocardia xinjiangensis]NMH77589.1 ATP-binding protein [Pseudonocardia xinjiangensis]